jgi:hypothetical protein
MIREMGFWFWFSRIMAFVSDFGSQNVKVLPHVKACMDRGELVPDSIIIDILRARYDFGFQILSSLMYNNFHSFSHKCLVSKFKSYC